MAFEPGIVTRVVTVGGSSSAEAALDLELVAKVSAVAMCEDGSTRPVLLIWEATGWRYESSPHTVTGAAGEAVSLPPLPVSDQSGWRDGETGFLLDVSAPGTHTHLYEIELVTKRGWGEVSRRIIGPFALPTGDGSPVDADLLIEADTVPGLLVSVPDDWSAQVAAAEAAAVSVADAIVAGDAIYARGLNVTSYGAAGDGTTNDTAAFAAAVAAAAGATITVPAGSYVLDRLIIPGRADFRLDDGATLLAQAPSTTNRMIEFTGTYLRIRGGTIDGRRALQVGVWPSIVYGEVQSGKAVIFDGVRFARIVRTALLARHFGGYISITDCEFSDQSEHSGTNGQYSTLLDVTSGQVGAKGHIRFNHNRAIYTGTPAVAGANPGGIFVNTQAAGVHDGDGNLSTIEAIGNHFVGYGQNAFGNDISPIHSYPTPGQMRIIGNYFEGCGFCAISAKSAQDVVITGNTIINGVYSAANISSEGAISYAPGYHAEAFQRPRAVIANNIVSNPGGTSVASKQYGIAVIGSAVSMADNVLITGNVLSGCGYGISIRYARDVSIVGNSIEGATGGTASSEPGIRFQDVIAGTILVADNRLTMYNGIGINLHNATATDATVVLTGNTVKQTATNAAINMRGAKVVKMSGNVMDAATSALYVGADAVPNNVGWFAYDTSNTILAGAATIQWAQITKATGQLFGTGSPKAVVTPGEAGTTWRRTDGREESLWIARGVTAADWTPVADKGTGVPTVAVGAAAGTGATASIVGTDAAGTIELTPGTGATIGGQLVVTFSRARREVPLAVIITPGSTAAAAAASNVVVHTSSPSRISFAVSATTAGLAEAGLHRWHYQVV